MLRSPSPQACACAHLHATSCTGRASSGNLLASAHLLLAAVGDPAAPENCCCICTNIRSELLRVHLYSPKYLQSMLEAQEGQHAGCPRGPYSSDPAVLSARKVSGRISCMCRRGHGQDRVAAGCTADGPRLGWPCTAPMARTHPCAVATIASLMAVRTALHVEPPTLPPKTHTHTHSDQTPLNTYSHTVQPSALSAGVSSEA